MLDRQVSLICIALTIACLWLFKSRPKAHLPPGPTGLPFFGSLFSLPTSYDFLTYTEWKKQYGDLIYYTVLGKSVLVINSQTVANDLLEKNSSVFSDRPHMKMIGLMGWDMNTSFMPWGSRWRQLRKLYHQKFHASAVVSYRPIQSQKIHDLLVNLLKTPEDFREHTRSAAAAISMRMTYGYDADDKEDKFIQLVEQAMDLLTSGMSTFGARLIDVLPFLIYFPEWMPCASFKTISRASNMVVNKLKNELLGFVKDSIREGTAQSCITTDLIESATESEETIKGTGVDVFVAGTNSTYSAFLSFIHAMVLHPDVARKGQEEIDRVTGGHANRMPTWDDRPQMPYVEAIYRELMRWHPMVPLNLPHSSSEDFVYDGLFIPKGTMVLANIWAMTHDEEQFPEPNKFKPERLLADDGSVIDNTISSLLTFGFGRRVCSGRYFADASVWFSIVSALAVYDFNKAKDIEGQEIEVTERFTSDAVIQPLPFQCEIMPRSEAARQLVMDLAQ